MSSGRQEYAYRLNDSGSNSYRTGSFSQGSSYGNRNPGPFPVSADTTSRRRGMNIEEILNPSDEDTRPSQQPQNSRSYEAETTVSRNPGSLQGNRVPGSGPRSHGANAPTRSRGSSRPRPRSRGSGSPEAPSRTRAFRPDYTCEEEHFIWYLRNDCEYSWNAIADAFNARFSQDGEGRREIPGLQCKYYRILEAYGLSTVRAMRRTQNGLQRYGMRAITGYTRETWTWLDGRHLASTSYGHMLADGRRA